MMDAKHTTYRVWMKDGYARTVTAESEAAARAIAIAASTKDCEGVSMSPREKKEAVTIDYVTNLNEKAATQ